jgi:hypothetical protein
MSPEASIALLMALVQAIITLAKDIPELVQIAKNVRDAVMSAQETGTDITDEQFDAMRADIDAALATLNSTP